MNIRDTQPTVVVCDDQVIRATLGLQEFLTRPSVTIKACYGVPRHADPAEPVASSSKSGWVVGEELERARKEAGDAAWDLKWPFGSSKAVDDWEGREFIFAHVYSLLGINIASNTSPLLLVPSPSPSGLALSEQALYTQLAFESLNVPALSILPSPLASVFALNSTTGVVLHVGRHSTQIVVVSDSVVRWETTTTVEVGTRDCEVWLEELLLADEAVDRQLSELGDKRQLVKELVQVIFAECTGDDIDIIPAGGRKAVAAVAAAIDAEEENFDIAKKLVGEAPAAQSASHRSKKQIAAMQAAASKAANDAANKAAADAASAAAADVIVLTIPSCPDKEITVGPIRHRLAEPLFRGKNGGDTIWEGLGRALESEGLSTAERIAAWEAVAVTGEMAKFKSFAPALLTYLAPLLLSSTEIPSDLQAARARLLSIPDYFTNFKGCANDEAPFLGASMVGKIAFAESAGKHCITKVDYNAKGPAAIYTVTSSEG